MKFECSRQVYAGCVDGWTDILSPSAEGLDLQFRCNLKVLWVSNWFPKLWFLIAIKFYVSQASTLSTVSPVYVLVISHELSKWRMLTGGSILASDWSEGSNAALSFASAPGYLLSHYWVSTQHSRKCMRKSRLCFMFTTLIWRVGTFETMLAGIIG